MLFVISFRKFKKTCLFRYDWKKRKPICENPYSKTGVCAEKNCPVLGGCVKVEKDTAEDFSGIIKIPFWKEVKNENVNCDRDR